MSEATSQPVNDETQLPKRHLVRQLITRIRQRPIKSGIVGGVMLLGLIGAAYVMSTMGGGTYQASYTVDEAMRKLDSKEFASAKYIAVQLEKSGNLSYSQLGIPTFIIGVALMGEAEDEWHPLRAKGLYLIAGRYLQETRRRGFPEGYEDEGVYLLGKSLFLADLRPHSLPILEEAISRSSEHATEIHQYLATIYLEDPNLSNETALENNQKYLDDRMLSDEQRSEGLLQRTKILGKLGRYAEGKQLLSQIPGESPLAPKVMIAQGQLLMMEAEAIQRENSDSNSAQTLRKTQPLYEQAMDVLRQAQSQLGIDDQAASEARYLLAVCDMRLGNFAEAESRFGLTRRENFDTPLGLAARVGEADVQLEQGKADEAFKNYLTLLEDSKKTSGVNNPWLSLADFEKRIRKAYRALVDQKQFERALQLAKHAWPPVPRDTSIQLQAEAQAAWARFLQDQSAGALTTERKQLIEQSLQLFRDAGRSYYKLSRLQLGRRNYPDVIWTSAEHYFHGHDYRSALSLYDEYLETNQRQRVSRSYLRKGESYLSLGDIDKALWALQQCILVRPSDPDAYRARLIASQVYLEKGQIEKAKNLLIDNLENESLTPASTEWRDSLFALGKTLFQEALLIETNSRRLGVDSEEPALVREGLNELERSHAVFRQAIGRLTEAVQRYADTPQSSEYRYLLGEAYRHAAKWPRKKLKTVTINATRFRLEDQFKRDLREAYRVFDELERFLNSQVDQRQLNEVEERILRNCYFAQADALFDLGDYEGAIKAYSSAASQYHDRPEALEAFLQIASCHRRLDQTEEARRTLVNARSQIEQEKIPASANFEETTRYSRQQWLDLLDWLIKI